MSSLTPPCALCERVVPRLTEHHLVPRSQGKKGQALPTILICSACHRQLHVLFSNEELARDFDTPEKLRAEPRMRKFIKWVRGQAPGKHIRVRR